MNREHPRRPRPVLTVGVTGDAKPNISSWMGEDTFSASKPSARRIASTGVAITREVPVTGLARTKHTHPHRTRPKALTSRPHRQRCNVRHAALHTLTRGCTTRPDEFLARFVAYLKLPKRECPVTRAKRNRMRICHDMRVFAVLQRQKVIIPLDYALLKQTNIDALQCLQ